MTLRTVTTLALSSALALSVSATPLGTAFTYQGKLADSGGVPLTGAYGMMFRLFDALEAGSQVGSTLSKPGVQATNGLFTVELDFGTLAFTGDKRWLEIAVEGNTISPRVEITNAPNAILAQTAIYAQAVWPNSVTSDQIVNDTIRNSDLAFDQSSLERVSDNTMYSMQGKIGIGIRPAGLLQVVGRNEYLDQEQVDSSYIYPTVTSFWQSFTAGKSGRLTSIEVEIGDANGQGYSAILNLYEGSGTSGRWLANLGFTGSSLQLRHINLINAPLLTAGNVYTMAFATGEFSVGILGVRTSLATDPYAGGRCSMSSNRDIAFKTYVSSDAPTAALFVDQANGYVGMNTMSPTQRLHVAGNICATGTIGACSDARFKTDVSPLTNALQLVDRLQPMSFDWRRDAFPDHHFADGRQIGFIAQQIRDILPEVVSEGSDGYYSVDYGRLTPILVQAIKEQQKEMDAKDARINELELRLERLEKLAAGESGTR